MALIALSFKRRKRNFAFLESGTFNNGKAKSISKYYFHIIVLAQKIFE